MKYVLQIVVALACVVAHATAAEVMLREQASPQGPIVRLGDVATIESEDDLVAAQLAATPLMPSPPEGTTQFLRNSEVRDLLFARGIDVRGLWVTGAAVVTIGPAAKPTTTSLDVFAAPQPEMTETSPDQLTAAIATYLQQQTGHDLWNVKVDADDDVMAAFAAAGTNAVISGGKAPWSGRQRFLIAGGTANKGAIAYARIERQEMVAIAVRNIERGDLIRRTDVELRPYAGALPKQAVLSLEALVGKEAVQSIRADSLVLSNQVRLPLMVRRGERVSVRVRAAGVTVRTYAVAQQDGSVGDLIALQSLEGKERYSACVSRLREVEILAGGSSAVEVASAPSPEIR